MFRRAGTMGAMFWLASGVSGVLLDGLVGGNALGTQILSWLSVGFGIWAFMRHGGPQITAPGLFCAASSVFVGYSGLWWLDYTRGEIPSAFLVATGMGYFATVLMYFGFWHSSAASVEPVERDPEVAFWAVNLGALLTAVSLTVYLIDPLEGFAEAAAFVGILILATGFTGTSHFRLTGIRSLAIAAVVTAFVVIAFDGFGRLPVLALGAAVAMIVSTRERRRTVKAIAILGIPFASAMLTALRAERLEASGSGDGPDSDVGGLWTFGRLIGGGFDNADGSTFWATAVIAVPRNLWESKPVGFGFELTGILEPQLLGVGHSMVATAFGEWYYNFGYGGIVMMIPAIGLAVRWLDRQRALLASSPLDSHRSILLMVVVAASVATMTDFVWSGTFTFAARMLLRLIVLLPLILIVSRRPRERRLLDRPTRPRPPASW